MVGIIVKDSAKDARACVRQFGITYPNGRDQDGNVAVDWGIVSNPATSFVSRAGAVERRSVGAIPESRPVERIDYQLSGALTSGDAEGANPKSHLGFDQDWQGPPVSHQR